MRRKAVSGIILAILLTSMLTLAFNIQPAKAIGTIYIRADGSIDPPSAPISTVGNVTYTLTDSITDSIVVERDNIVVDGADYTLQGTNAYPSKGIDLTGRSNVTIKNTTIKAFSCGIFLNSSSTNSIAGNNITNNGIGIGLEWSSNNNSISGNNITNNYGIVVLSSNYNSIVGNVFTNGGLWVRVSYGNVVEDNLVNGKPLVYLEDMLGFTIENAGQVILINCDNIRIENLNLSYTSVGIELWNTTNTKIARNNITNNWIYGVELDYSSNNSIAGNNITNTRTVGICLSRSSSNNSIAENNITNNWAGIGLSESSNNKFYHNNFIDNTRQVYFFDSGYANVWDDGYPSSGNHWSDYTDVDFYSGPYQNETGSDSIWDHPYIIDTNNQDHYPFVNPWAPTPNQPPVASFTYSPASPVHSGDMVSFDASSSYDPEGGTISYEWDFGDGETATGCNVSHRFRGAIIDPETNVPRTKDYIITLTVRDNKGAIDTESASLTVEPLRKIVDVGPGNLGVSCWMEAIYNWVGTDEATGENLYIISRIDTYSGGISGAYQLFILRRMSPPPSMPKLIWHIPLPTMPILRTYATPFTPSLWQKLWGTPCEPTKLIFPDGTFEGIAVTDTSLMLIVATGTETGITLCYDAGITKFEPGSPIVRLKPEELKELWELRDIIDLLNKLIGIIGSPGELRIYDSEGRVTGLVNGEIKEEIPGSAYANGTILILYPNGTYRHEVVGIDKGAYRLLVTSVENVNATTLTAIEIPTASNAVHQYTIDWATLSQGQEGITVQIDSDADGSFEHEFSSDSELTGEEFEQAILHDISIGMIQPSKNIIGEGYPLLINATVRNQGSYPENFNIILFADRNITIIGDEITIGTQIVHSLTNGTSTVITFTWNTIGVAKGNYTISAYAWPVLGEADTGDNTYVDGVVLVTVVGDVDGNRKVDIDDLVFVIGHVPSKLGSGPPAYKEWDPNMDVNSDDLVDITDMVVLINNFLAQW